MEDKNLPKSEKIITINNQKFRVDPKQICVCSGFI